MENRQIAAAYRLANWAKRMEERAASGMKVREYCEAIGVHENTYYYWQSKLSVFYIIEMQQI